MKTMSHIESPGRVTRVSVALLLAALAGSGCGDLFDVENPGSLTTSELDDADLTTALLNTPEGQVCAAWGSTTAANALQADDVTFVGSYTFTELHMWGWMEGYNSTQNSVWNSLASSRWTAEDVTGRLEKRLPNPTANVDIARGVFWGAFARVALADHFKEVPFDRGVPQAPDKVLEETLARFDRAAQIAQAAGDKSLQAAALATKARVYRSLYFERGKQQSFFTSAMQAADQALAVKADFSYSCRYAQPGSQNTLAQYWTSITGSVLDPKTAELKDPVSGVHEPRIPIGPSEVKAPAPHTGFIYRFYKYPLRDSPLPVSRWAEARLILAEGNLLNGNLAEAVRQINLVRAAAKLPAFASTNAAAIRDQLLYERRAEFVAEGRRLQDHRYYNIIPWQWDEINKQKGTNRRWPVSAEEIASNPNYHLGS